MKAKQGEGNTTICLFGDDYETGKEWFEKLAEAYLALWWLPAGRLPTVEEAEWRIGLMRQHGPTAEAFTFRSPFGPPAASRRRGPAIDAEFCWAG